MNKQEIIAKIKNNINSPIGRKYLIDFLSLSLIALGIYLIISAPFNILEIISIIIIYIIGIIFIFHRVNINIRLNDLKNEYLKEVHDIHKSIFNVEVRLKNDLSGIIEELLNTANDEFGKILKEVHEEIASKGLTIKEEDNINDKTEDNTVIKEVELGKD